MTRAREGSRQPWGQALGGNGSAGKPWGQALGGNGSAGRLAPPYGRETR